MAKQSLSDYEKSIINFYVRGTLSDLSKTILLFLIFYGLGFHRELLCSVFFLLLFRVFSGGIHCSTYLSCFLLSLVILSSGVYLGVNLFIPKNVMLFLGLMCGIITVLFSPVLSSSRPKLSTKEKLIAKAKLGIIIAGFLISIALLDINSYSNIGFWLLIIHTAQLAVAHIRR